MTAGTRMIGDMRRSEEPIGYFLQFFVYGSGEKNGRNSASEVLAIVFPPLDCLLIRELSSGTHRFWRLLPYGRRSDRNP